MSWSNAVPSIYYPPSFLHESLPEQHCHRRAFESDLGLFILREENRVGGRGHPHGAHDQISLTKRYESPKSAGLLFGEFLVFSLIMRSANLPFPTIWSKKFRHTHRASLVGCLRNRTVVYVREDPNTGEYRKGRFHKVSRYSDHQWPEYETDELYLCWKPYGSLRVRCDSLEGISLSLGLFELEECRVVHRRVRLRTYLYLPL